MIVSQSVVFIRDWADRRGVGFVLSMLIYLCLVVWWSLPVVSISGNVLVFQSIHTMVSVVDH